MYYIQYNKYKGDLANYLFVGNGQEDLEFARQAEIKFIFIDRKDSVRKAEIRNEQGVYILKNLEEIITVVKEQV